MLAFTLRGKLINEFTKTENCRQHHLLKDSLNILKSKNSVNIFWFLFKFLLLYTNTIL